MVSIIRAGQVGAPAGVLVPDAGGNSEIVLAVAIVDPVTGAAASAGGGGDASAANQGLQLAQETAAAGVLGATAGAAVITDANGTVQQYLRGLIVKILVLIGLFPTSLGSKAAASSFAVTQSTEDAAQLGSLTEGAPATDTASSGLNGRLQRIAQRLTSLIALLPASLGAKLASASLSVTQGAFLYKLAPASATTTMTGAGAGAAGDFLSHVIIQPTTTALAAFSILDNAVVVFASAAQTLLDLRPIVIPINANSVSGAWKITMSTGGTATGFGIFT